MENLHFRCGHSVEAEALVLKHHYSHRKPVNVQIVGSFHEDGGLFGDFGPAVAACFFSLPPTRWTVEVWELSRLVRDEKPRPLSQLISKTCKVAKKRGAHLLVSFADWAQSHHGGIYQASSWNYSGCRDRQMDGVLIDGIFFPGRSCNNKWGTRSPKKLTEILRKPVKPHWDEGKHLYWRALTNEGRKRAKILNLLSIKYPKPDNDGQSAEQMDKRQLAGAS